MRGVGEQTGNHHERVARRLSLLKGAVEHNRSRAIDHCGAQMERLANNGLQNLADSDDTAVRGGVSGGHQMLTRQTARLRPGNLAGDSCSPACVPTCSLPEQCMSETVEVRVLFFARARELAGVSSAALKLTAADASSPVTVSNARTALLASYPALEPLLASKSTLITVNAEYIDSETGTVLRTGDELAIVPPVSGG